MRNRAKRFALVAVCTVCVLAMSLPAQAAPSKLDLPYRHIGALDGPTVQISDNDGRNFAFWSYRNGVEYDIAVSMQDDEGFWSNPRFFGAHDGIDQVHPAVAIDVEGNIYLAFELKTSGRILMKILPDGSDMWTTSVSLTGVSRRGTRPALQVVRNRLVVAYQDLDLDQTVIVARPVRSESPHLQGLQDDPDPATDYRDPGDSSENDDETIGGDPDDQPKHSGAMRTHDASEHDD